MELEVLVGDVGQDRDVVGDRPDAFEREAVGGALDDRRGVARHGHRTQRELEGRRLGRRDVRLVGFLDAADPCSGGPDHPGPHARRLERGDRQERRRGLAVRAGDPDDVQLAARIVVPPCRGGRERGMGIRHDELREGDLGQRARSTIADDAPAAAASATKSCPSTCEPGGRDEQRARADVARVVRDAADRDAGETDRADRPTIAAGPAQPALGGQAVDQAAERRGRRSARPRRGGRRSSRRGHRRTRRGDACRQPSRRGSAAAGSRARGRRPAPASARRSERLCW